MIMFVSTQKVNLEKQKQTDKNQHYYQLSMIHHLQLEKNKLISHPSGYRENKCDKMGPWGENKSPSLN